MGVITETIWLQKGHLDLPPKMPFLFTKGYIMKYTPLSVRIETLDDFILSELGISITPHFNLEEFLDEILELGWQVKIKLNTNRDGTMVTISQLENEDKEEWVGITFWSGSVQGAFTEAVDTFKYVPLQRSLRTTMKNLETHLAQARKTYTERLRKK